MSNQEYEEQEIDLRDYIEVIIKRRKIILIIFLVSVIVTGIYSVLIPNVYKATASLMITPSKTESLFLSTQTLARESLIQKPVISLGTHKSLLISNIVLERIGNKLNLTDKSGNKLLPEDLSDKLNIKETKETNIIQLEVQDTDPKSAKEIANTWAREYIIYNMELISGEVKGTGDFIAGQFEITKQNLVQYEEKAKDFKGKYKIDIMRAETDIKKTNLNGYKKELMEIEITLKTKEDFLREFKKEIEKQEKFTIVSKAITDDALWQQALKEKRVSDLDKKKLRSEEINPIYRDLETKIVDTEIEINTIRPKTEYLKNSITLTEKEIDELERTINQKEFELTQLNRQIEIYKRTYDNLSPKIEDMRLAQAVQLGEVRIISPAIELKYSIKPNKIQMVAISGIVGLFIGIILSFFVEYWQKGKDSEKQQR